MNKKIRAVALVLLLFLSFLLISCKKDDSQEVMRYGDAAISEKMFMYELSFYKTQTLTSLGISETNFNDFLKMEITDETGNANTSHYNWGDYLYQECILNLRTKLYFADIAIKAGGLGESEKTAVDEQLKNVVAQLGSKSAVNKYLETYGIDYNIYREWLELYQLYNMGVNLAYAEGGVRAIPFEEAYQFYRDNYVTVKHVAIGTEIAGEDELGNVQHFSEEEKEARRAVIDEVRKKIEEGVDFDTLYAASEDGQAALYPDGYTITEGALSDEMKGYEETALSLEIGEVGEWEKEGYGYYFIKRVDLLESDFYNCQSVFLPTLIEIDKVEAVTEGAASFVENSDIINSYNLNSIPAFS